MKHFHRLLRGAAAMLLTGVVLGCSGIPAPTADGRVYHCVGTGRPAAPPNTWAKKMPLEKFEYGDYVTENRPTIAGSSYCATLPVPKTAYLRYQVDGRMLEKHFDLSSLTPRRVRGKDVEFFVDGETVEVRLLTPIAGTYRNTTEVIDRR
ncbi:MAG: hypothetical protein LBE78_11330 [Burkholderiaceae bacterium]|jgi:hypothetical protein|nr:hypothetical protein [Burkholderiaceae bacterium]